MPAPQGKSIGEGAQAGETREALDIFGLLPIALEAPSRRR